MTVKFSKKINGKIKKNEIMRDVYVIDTDMQTHNIHTSALMCISVLCIYIYIYAFIHMHIYIYTSRVHTYLYTLYICIQGLIKYIKQLLAMSFTLILSKHLLAKILTVCIKCTLLIFSWTFVFYSWSDQKIKSNLWFCTGEFTIPFIEVTFLMFSLLENSHRFISGNVLQNRIQ